MGTEIDYDSWIEALTLRRLGDRFLDLGCHEVFVKYLAPNNNSKNQIYLAGDFQGVSCIPSGGVVARTGSSRRPHMGGDHIFHSPVDLWWLSPDGEHRAPNAKLAYHPQYPEVRLSALLKGCRSAPEHLLVKDRRGTEPGRILLLGVHAPNKRVYSLVTPGDCAINNELRSLNLPTYGSTPTRPDSSVFHVWTPGRRTLSGTPREILLNELCRIHRKAWIPGQRLSRREGLKRYNATNAGGFTLEAELGIFPNGDAKPDFHGWEVKQYSVKDIDRTTGTGDVTMFTPQPDGGLFHEDYERFMRLYGKKSATPDGGSRWDFVSRPINRLGDNQRMKPLTEVLQGYTEGGTPDSNGYFGLADERTGDVVASWSFSKLIEHWKRKHSLEVLVRSQLDSADSPDGTIVHRYRYGRNVRLGTGTDFKLFLNLLSGGVVRYDPGCKHLLSPEGKVDSKRRNQFRIRSTRWELLFHAVENVDACVSRP